MSSLSTGTTPPGAGRTAAVVVISVAVLGAVGGIFGYLIGAKANPSGGAGASTSATAPRTGPPTTPQSTGTELPRCPDFVQERTHAKGAKGVLREELWVLTSNTEIWICHDDAPGGQTWWQGHVFNAPQGPYQAGGPPPVERPGEAILLTGVNGLDNGRFQVRYQDNGVSQAWTVSRAEFVIQGLDKNGKPVAGTPFTQKVIEHRP
jgi:hypothetical protein